MSKGAGMNNEQTYPDCSICADSGLHGGHDRPYEFCLCAAGVARAADSGAVDDANRVKDLLEKKFGALA